ncbi:hypothetical protein [Streptomyces sp. 7N604]|uniref:hypothetical protein n=1 Tax=Streptomyces sp. 7N604 TaxID=3457415 RepID=UPI003FD1A1D7
MIRKPRNTDDRELRRMMAEAVEVLQEDPPPHREVVRDAVDTIALGAMFDQLIKGTQERQRRHRVRLRMAAHGGYAHGR